MKRLRNLILTLTVPLAKLISFLGKPEPRRSHDDYVEIKRLIQPGDLLVTREDYRMSNWIIPGFWSHVAIYLGDEFILEAVPPRVREVSLDEFVMSVDSIAILRPKFLIEYNKIMQFAIDYVGAPYNFALFWRHAWVCSKLVAFVLKKACALKRVPFRLRKTFGISTGSPQDFYDDRKNFNLIYERR